MSKAWLTLLWRLVAMVMGAGLLGWLTGHILLALAVAALGSLGWQLWQLYQLDRWLNGDQEASPPRTGLVWEGVYTHVARLRRQSRKRKRKFSRLAEQFQQATSALPDATVLLSDDDKLIWCNGASQALFGLSLNRDVGLPITHLLRHPRFVAFLTQRRDQDQVEFPSPVDDTLLISARIVPYGKKQRLLLATEVSHVRRLEQMRRDFVANVSHELRTPLTVIIGYLETLLDSDSDNSALTIWRHPLRCMQQQSSRMLHIVEDLLMLARLESQKERSPRKPVNVPALLADITEDAIALSGERGHAITLAADPQLWILGCEKELCSAFSNLAFNAVRYTPPGGQIQIRWFADERAIYLEVEDNGEGIAPQHLPRLTERFYRINRDRSRNSGGTGLGLSIVKHVLNNHDGHLQITSELGVGSIFTCDFPLELRVDPSKSQSPLNGVDRSC